MKKNIDFIKNIYQNAEVGIIEINEVLYKVKNIKLEKELIKEKKNFEKIKKRCIKYLAKYKSKPRNISILTKISSEFYAEMRLIKENSDVVILKMIIDSAYKSIGILTAKLVEYDMTDSESKKIGEDLLWDINNNIVQLKKFNKIC